jgi:hypothetical protein
MKGKIELIRSAIEPLRNEVVNHKIYGAINDIEDLKIFMKYHVFAVWDFMSLLKSLQNNLTCTAVPWFPVGSADTRYLINEIVVGEESDVDFYGERKSHFELYLEAMHQCGADTNLIEGFLKELKTTGNLNRALMNADVPEEAKHFVDFTFRIIQSKKVYLQSAVFTFGREDLIPHMFHSIVKDIYDSFPNTISVFKYYLERHIEVDGDHHSHLALQMTSKLCESDESYWMEAELAVLESLEKRIELWNGAYNEILKSRSHR